MTSGVTTIQKKQNKSRQKKGLTKLISLNSVRPFCRFHTYYLTTTRFRINNTKISCVIILLSNRILSALKRPVYKEFQKIFIIQTRKVQFALWYFSAVSVLKQFIHELFCIDSLCFHLIVLSFYCQQLILHLSKFISRQPLFYSLFFPLYFNFHASKNSEICVSEV